jgi:hypothetical protein
MAAQSLFVGSGLSFVGCCKDVAFGCVTGAVGTSALHPARMESDKDNVSAAGVVSFLMEAPVWRKVQRRVKVALHSKR